MVIDLTEDGDEQMEVSKKRNIIYVDLTLDDVSPIQKCPMNSNESYSLKTNLKKLPRVLICKIFEEYLSIKLIKEILRTPIDILRTSIRIHQALISRVVPKKALIDIMSLSTFILTHIGVRAPIFTHFASVNKKVTSCLQVNDVFDSYQTSRSGTFIILKTLKTRAIVQKIKRHTSKLVYKGMTIDTVMKISPKKSISLKILNEQCVFSSIQKQNVCFINNAYTPISVSYYTDDSYFQEKYSNIMLSDYSLIM